MVTSIDHRLRLHSHVSGETENHAIQPLLNVKTQQSGTYTALSDLKKKSEPLNRAFRYANVQ